MEITSENVQGLTSSIRISIKEEDYIDNVNKTLKKYQREAKMPGFRPGKVPAGLIRKMYKRAAVADEINVLISQKLQEHIAGNELKLLGEPLPGADQKQVDFETDTDFEFVFDIAVQPDFEVDLNKRTKVDYHIVEIGEKEVDDYMNDLLKRNGEVVEVEEVAEGDYMRGSLAELDDQGEELDEGIKKENALLAVDYLQTDEAKAKFLGKKTGDIVVLNPSADLVNVSEIASLLEIDKEKAAGLKSDFHYSISSISRMAPAEVNDDLFARVFPNDNISSEEELRERVKEDISASYQHESKSLFYFNAMEKISNKLDIELPDEFMKRWLVESAKEEVTSEEAEQQWEIYAPMLKRQLLENKLMKDHELEITQEDIRRQVMLRIGMPIGEEETEEQKQMAERLVSTVMQNEEQAMRIKEEIERDKISGLLFEKIKADEKNISVEEFVTLVTEHNQR